VLAGYAPGNKGYRIYLDSGTITVAKDIIFDETKSVASATMSAGSNSTQQPTTPSQPSQPMETDVPDLEGAQQRASSRKRSPPGEWWVAPPSDRRSTALTAVIQEPVTVQEAMQSEYAAEWRSAMDDEIASLHSNKTWTL
jgi:hypothetical protein